MQDRSFPRQPVPLQEPRVARAFGNLGAVAGEIELLIAADQPVERGHVVRHRAVRRRHDGGRPAHDVIADEQRITLAPGERHVVGGVTRRRHRLDRPAVAFDHVAVADFDVRLEVAVGAGLRRHRLALEIRPRRPMRPFGIDGGAGRLLDQRRAGRMILVGVGDQDVRDGLAFDGVQQRIGMGLVRRARIDDRDLAATDDVADGAGESERRRIVAQHAAQAGTDFLDDARLQSELAIERNVVLGAIVVAHGVSNQI